MEIIKIETSKPNSQYIHSVELIRIVSPGHRQLIKKKDISIYSMQIANSSEFWRRDLVCLFF